MKHQCAIYLKGNVSWMRNIAYALLAMLILSLFACGKSHEQSSQSGEAETKQKKYVLLPATKEHPYGLIEVRFKSRVYRIPKEYAIVTSDGELGYFIYYLSWPSLKPIVDQGPQAYGRFDLIQVTITTESQMRNDVSDSELEKIIISRHEQPFKLKSYPELQEYPSKDTTPHYRAVDNTVRWADGLPTYFYCGGGAITNGFDTLNAPFNYICTIELSWQDGVCMDIVFKRRLFGEWKIIHDRVTTWFENYRVK